MSVANVMSATSMDLAGILIYSVTDSSMNSGTIFLPKACIRNSIRSVHNIPQASIHSVLNTQQYKCNCCNV